MKYDMTVRSLEENTSQAKLLARVPPGTTVLECGCATGYMTRVLRDELHCTVTILERDPAAFELASPFATEGYCTDLTQRTCWDALAGRQFDVILFADVLEHLPDPKAILRQATEHLAPEGVMLCSIPNVGHNDLLLKLYAQHWEVMPRGLLDESHLHFWAYHDILHLCDDTALTLTELDGIYLPTSMTEQSTAPLYALPSTAVRALAKRDYGEVYQFILTLRPATSTAAQLLVHAHPIARFRRASFQLRKEAWYSYFPGLRALRKWIYRRKGL